MLTRRIVAFEANITRLLLRKCCLWTFTLKEVLEPREAGKRWTELLKALRRTNPDWSGVRVFELHPGRWGEFSHGLHVHLVSCDFYSDKILNSLVRSYGWGRWDRRPIFEREAAFYIGKYLQKKRPGALRGMRLQSCFGLRDFTRFRDVIIECDRSRAWKQLSAEVRAEGGECPREVWGLDRKPYQYELRQTARFPPKSGARPCRVQDNRGGDTGETGWNPKCYREMTARARRRAENL